MPEQTAPPAISTETSTEWGVRWIDEPDSDDPESPNPEPRGDEADARDMQELWALETVVVSREVPRPGPWTPVDTRAAGSCTPDKARPVDAREIAQAVIDAGPLEASQRISGPALVALARAVLDRD